MATMSVNLTFVVRVSDRFITSEPLGILSYSAGLFFFLFFEQVFGPGPFRLNRRLWQVHLLSVVMVYLAVSFSWARLGQVSYPYSVLNILSVIYVVVITLINTRSGNRDIRIFALGLTLLGTTLCVDILSAIKIDSFSNSRTTPFGLFAFIICLLVILRRRYTREGTGLFDLPLSFLTEEFEFKLRAESMVMHSIKNEIHRLSYFNDRNRRLLPYLDATQSLELIRNMDGMDNGINHMLSMVEAIKQTDDIVLNRILTDCNALLQSTVSAMQSRINSSGIEIKLDVAGTVLAPLDPVHIKECILNLLINSIEAIEHERGQILISLYANKHWVTIEVSDNGKGIPETNTDDVFIPFYTTKESGLHNGIGLYYTYLVMKRHGGYVKVIRSELGKGTTIQLVFPFEATQVEACRRRRHAESASVISRG